jgi:hypothetical protein
MFDFSNISQIYFKLQNTEGFSPELADLIKRGLSENPSRRPMIRNILVIELEVCDV